MWYEVGAQLHSFACGYPVVPAPFLKRLFVAPLNCPGTLVKNQLTVNVRVYFWILNSISLICTCVFVPVPHCLDYFDFITALKSGSLSLPTLFFFKSVLAILCHINFRLNLSISAKKTAGLLIGIVLNLDQFGEYCRFNNIVFQSLNVGCLFIYLSLL